MEKPDIRKSPPMPDLFMVIFYDHLGTSDQLASWSNSELWKSEDEAAVKGFVKYCKTIVKTRNSFKSYSEDVNNISIGAELDKYRSKIDREALDEIDKLRLGTIRHQKFSDTNIWFLQTADDEIDGKCFGRAMNGMLTGLSYCHLQALAGGHFCRAGVDLGYGTDLGDYSDGEEIHGPVLLSAYELEGKADWARLVVGDDLVYALDHRIQQLAAGLSDASTKSEWVICFYEHHFLSDMRSMIIQDDGVFMVDFAGATAAKAMTTVMRKNGDSPADFYQLILYEVAEQVQEHFEAGHQKHLDRAKTLQAYLQSRKIYWVQ